MSRFISLVALVIFVVAVGVNVVFFGDGAGGPGDGSGGADAAGSGPGNPAGEDFISPGDIEVPDQPGGGVPIGEVDIRAKEGRTNGQRDFAREFVKAVYGPSAGSSAEAYVDAVSDYIQPESYELSDGWSEIESRADGSDPVDSAAVLVGYEISQGLALGTSVPASAVEGFTADGALSAEDLEAASLVEMSYAVGSGYDESVEGGPEDYSDASVLLTGSVRYYSQSLVLAPLTSPDGQSEPWTVLAGSEPAPIDNPNANAPDPSDLKVGEPGLSNEDGGESGDGHSHGQSDGNSHGTGH